MKKEIFFISAFIIAIISVKGQCVRDTMNIYKFTDNQIRYEVIKENKTWEDAQTCAVVRGGNLAIINSQSEQDSVFANLNRANITNSNTAAADGGGAAYVWLAGNDTVTEGDWYWDNASGTNAQFWMGTKTGSAVGSLYNNWGNEPDDFQGRQDALGLALSSWPFGVAGEWNDLDETDTLYYLIEYPVVNNLPEFNATTANFTLFPNPAQDELSIKCDCRFNQKLSFQIVDAKGAVVQEGTLKTKKFNVGNLKTGQYWLKIEGKTEAVPFQKK